MKMILAGLVAFALMNTALGTTYTGPVLAIQTSPSPTTPNSVRISVQVSGTSGCSNASWYSAEFPDSSGTRKIWIASLLAAQARSANVTVAGTGTCDPYGIETIHYINALP